jgi:hypothetical protein
MKSGAFGDAAVLVSKDEEKIILWGVPFCAGE